MHENGTDQDEDDQPAPRADGFFDVADDDRLVKDGALIGVRAAGQAVVIARANGCLHAVSGVCTHASVLLENGWIVGTNLHCPLHQAAFSLVTGAATEPPACAPLDVYDVRAEGGRVLIRPREIPAPCEKHG